MQIKRSKQWRGKCKFSKEVWPHPQTKPKKKKFRSSLKSPNKELVRANEELAEKQRIIKEKMKNVS